MRKMVLIVSCGFFRIPTNPEISDQVDRSEEAPIEANHSLVASAWRLFATRLK